MRGRYVVDTNILIAASAVDPISPADISATPEDPNLRREIWSWLSAFAAGEIRMVLDLEMKIYDEYTKKLSHGDFGIQVVINKWSKDQVDNVKVTYDAHGHGVIPDALDAIVHDLEDRKFIAASIESLEEFGEGCIAFAGDTDWHEWETALYDYHIILEPVIEEWSRAKHAEKARNR